MRMTRNYMYMWPNLTIIIHYPDENMAAMHKQLSHVPTGLKYNNA